LVEKQLIQQYHEDIIVPTGGLNGEIPNKILNLGEKPSRRSFNLVEKIFWGRFVR
jgi:DNA polymerase-3 subunit alpha